jgi:hypothetical protein
MVYGQDLAHVCEAAVDPAASVQHRGWRSPAGRHIHELGQGVAFELRFFHSDDDRFEARRQAAEAPVNALDEAGIELSAPGAE